MQWLNRRQRQQAGGVVLRQAAGDCFELKGVLEDRPLI